jgi:hypothetical protein
MRSLAARQLACVLIVLTMAACGGAQESASSTVQQESTTLTTTASTTQPSGSVPTTGPTAVTPGTTSEFTPRTYSVDADGLSSTGPGVEFTISERGWTSFVGAYKTGQAVDYVAAKFVAVTSVASAACDSTTWVGVGDTAEDLALGLAQIEDFVTQVAPTTVSAYGYNGYHLVLEVPDLEEFQACDDGYFDGYEGPTIGRYYQGPNQVVEFWALDVEGTPLLIEATWFPDSPEEDVAALRAILDSVRIVP